MKRVTSFRSQIPGGIVVVETRGMWTVPKATVIKVILRCYTNRNRTQILKFMEQPENYSHAINRLTIYNGLTSWSKLANSIAVGHYDICSLPRNESHTMIPLTKGYNVSSFGDIKIVEKSDKKFHLEEKSNYLGQLVRLRKLVDEAKESHRSVARAHQSSLSSSLLQT
ncbi:hypothetical protein V1478_008078 [Vespula squamosa]|uniref:Uncharacterized protein n=1 Tax=Vespula squamosa TaxID=30214 RepID=A0ABD2B0C3_VESSQ